MSIRSFKPTRLYLSFNNFITHLVAKINFFDIDIDKGTPCTLPPIFKGNSSTVGDIFNIE